MLFAGDTPEEVGALPVTEKEVINEIASRIARDCFIAGSGMNTQVVMETEGHRSTLGLLRTAVGLRLAILAD